MFPRSVLIHANVIQDLKETTAKSTLTNAKNTLLASMELALIEQMTILVIAIRITEGRTVP